MAMVGNDLGDAILAAIPGAVPNPTLIAVWRAIGSAIVTYMKSNMDIQNIETEIDAAHLATNGLVGTSTGAWPGDGAYNTFIAASMKEKQTNIVHPL
jgi:hypothetical protein